MRIACIGNDLDFEICEFTAFILQRFSLGQINTITTAVPFLQIAPDSRAGGMGDYGVATSPDANSIHWNPAKLAFIEKMAGSLYPILHG